VAIQEVFKLREINGTGLGDSGIEKENREFMEKLMSTSQKEDATMSSTLDGGTWALAVRFIREEIDYGQIFEVTRLCAHLGITDPKEKKIVARAISYLGSKGETVRGDYLGTWKKAEAELASIPLMPDDEDEYFHDFRFPLLQDVKVQRGDVLLFAGFTSTGKTCLALNFVRLNQHLFAGVNYLSNQCGQVNKRLTKFKKHDGLEREDWKFELCPREENFAPVIYPEHLTIIDFLDALDGDYSKMGGLISQIHNKIEDKPGIVVVFLQKPEGRDSGFGGQQTHSFANFSAVIDDLRGEGENRKSIKVIKSKLTPEHQEKIMIYRIDNEGTKLVPLTPLEYPSRLAKVEKFQL